MRHFWVILPILAGCGFSPTEGVWKWTSVDVVSDNCGVDTEELESSTVLFGIAESDDGDLIVSDPSGDLPDAACQYDKTAFLCDPIVVDAVAGETTYTISLVYSGEFSDESSMSGTAQYTYVCEGPDCTTGTIEFPCNTQLTFNAAPR